MKFINKNSGNWIAVAIGASLDWYFREK